ncbi:MAG TPA: RNA polymerase sigma factor [Clostridium sp.]|jgi:RNA polymerase sigma-70 factor (ECF subfamily)|nr:RNA polymerase sigma factor [Clostridium sp.]
MFEEKKLQRLQDKDVNAIEEICSLTWKSVYRFIYFKVQNRQEAEDITQETYVKTLSYLERNNAEVEKYTSFLKVTALNILRDRWRKKKRLGLNADLEAINPKEIAVEDDTEAYTQRAIMQEALNRLNEEQRTVIELRILKGYSTKETARIMEKKEGTIRVLQYRALKNLSEILENMGS